MSMEYSAQQRGSQRKEGISREKVEELNSHGKHRWHSQHSMSSLEQEISASRLSPQLPRTRMKVHRDKCVRMV